MTPLTRLTLLPTHSLRTSLARSSPRPLSTFRPLLALKESDRARMSPRRSPPFSPLLSQTLHWLTPHLSPITGAADAGDAGSKAKALIDE